MLLAAATNLLLVCRAVEAAQYPGGGDTGWVYASKRDCCSAAIGLAAEYSARACLNVGGIPRTFAGSSQRGTCSAEWTQHEGGLLYRCYGEATVSCR